MKNILSFLLFLFLLSGVLDSELVAQSVSQFRGPHRDGIYPESGLLRSWPEQGPVLQWQFDGIGEGFSSPIISGDMIFVTGETDSTGFLTALDRSGKLLWKKELSSEWMDNFFGPRSTPTLSGDLLYICSSMGRIYCLEAGSGKERWSVDMLKDLHGVNVRFGYSEGLLVDGDILYCAPGGADTNVVALNRYTGKMIWKSKALGDSTAYCSPLLISLPARKVLVNYTIHNLIGLDAANGELLWSVPQSKEADIQASTPLFCDGYLYVVNGSGNGASKYELLNDGREIREVWSNPKVTDIHGGFVKIGNYIYSSQYRPRRYCSVDCSNGSIADSLKFDKGAVIAADSMLYLYTEKGMVGLVKPDQGKMQLVSSFKMPVGSKEFFTIPVIDRGTLYLRHGNTILAYNIRRE